MISSLETSPHPWMIADSKMCNTDSDYVLLDICPLWRNNRTESRFFHWRSCLIFISTRRYHWAMS